jgi:8-oxo-dGTP diphosphatase
MSKGQYLLEKLSDDHSLQNSESALSAHFSFGVSVDCMVFGYHQETLKILAIKRGAEPYKGHWALPGDLVLISEDIDIAAKRVLRDLTGLDHLFMEQTKVYGEVNRHPQGRVITAGFYALIDIAKHDPHAAGWAEGVSWLTLNDLPKLAFDHNKILQDGLIRLRERVRRKPIGFELLPKKFALSELQSLYEALLNEKYDKANFRKKILAMKILRDLKEMQVNVSHRPGRLYSFNEERYIQLLSKGFSFEL